jgi:hypothetical protein
MLNAAPCTASELDARSLRCGLAGSAGWGKIAAWPLQVPGGYPRPLQRLIEQLVQDAAEFGLHPPLCVRLLLQAAPARPYVLDDATVVRIIRVHRDQAEDLTLFQNQADRWKTDLA